MNLISSGVPAKVENYLLRINRVKFETIISIGFVTTICM